MSRLTQFLSWKPALIIQTVFFSLSLLQRDFYFGQLWFIINCFVLVALLRASYGESSSHRLVAWYLYCVSVFTDTLSLAIFGGDDKHYSDFTFCLVMAILMLVPKPLFTYFLYKQLKDEGVDIRRGMRASTQGLAEQTYKGVDSGLISSNNNGANPGVGPGGMAAVPGSYGFADTMDTNDENQTPANDPNDFMTNIPPATNPTDGDVFAPPSNNV